MTYLSKHINTRETLQTEAVKGTVRNSAGGQSFEVGPWTKLDRFLVLGTEGGSYYASERDLTKQSYEAVKQCLALDYKRTVDRIVDISQSGRAPKNDPALFALAVAAAYETGTALDPVVRNYALSKLPLVARIGTHLFHFLAYVQNLRGWGRGLRNAVSHWYLSQSPQGLATQLFKYQGRDGWTHKDALALAHTAPQTHLQRELFHYAVKGDFTRNAGSWSEAEGKALVWAMQASRLLSLEPDTPVAEVTGLISDHQFPRELVPTHFLKHPEVWEAMLPHMGLTAMIRNLGKMTEVGLLVPLSEASKLVVSKLNDTATLKASRVHPIQLLSAKLVYGSGHGVRGSLSWKPVPTIGDALERAFYASFKTIEPTGLNHLLALDVSSSMTCGVIAGVPGLTPSLGSTAMAMVTARTEPNYHVMGFSHTFRELGITASDTLETALGKTQRQQFGGTDCALPMQYALERKIPVNTFVVYTDSETWAGRVHPFQALRKYRDAMGIPARLAVVGMVANNFTIADPSDTGMLDVVGFDTATPALLADFAKGAF